MKKIILGVVALAVIAGFVYWKYAPTPAAPQEIQEISLTYWGLWEDEDAIRPVIAAYKKVKPNVTINYVKQTSLNYRTRLQTQIRGSQGPDIFRIHDSWVPMFLTDITPVPAKVMTPTDYGASFYPIAVEMLTRQNTIYAIPVSIDGIGLYYNEDILSAAGVTPPTSWATFIESATKMTVRETTGQIRTAGAALGATGNVDHWSDIIGLLFLQQPKGNLVSPNNQDGAEAISFFNSFVTSPERKTWDASLPSSTNMFIQGRLAYYFAPSWRAHELRQANPSLKFKTVPVPQLPGKKVAWATFWAETVSSKSKHPEEAWEFVKFLTSAENQRLLYQHQSQTRLFGEPYSKPELSSLLLNDPLVGSFISQAPFYRSWYLNSRTFDIGINDEMIKYYEDAVNAILGGADPKVALGVAEQGVKQVLDKYTQGAPSITQ